jgi:hypothetical protein
MKANLFFIKRLCSVLTKVLPVLLLFLIIGSGKPDLQQPDYRKHFGKNYEFAENFIRQNHHLFIKTFNNEKDARIASAIVFPELIRYNTLRDKIETGALRALYVQYGANYADFSIGFFQMKPSFAEYLEKQQSKATNTPNWVCDALQDAESRSRRITRLSTLQGQMTYLSMFYDLMKNRFGEYIFLSDEEKIRFYATAFNTGCNRSYDEIMALSHNKQFHTSLFKSNTTPCFAYCDVAICFYRAAQDNFHKN